MDEQHAEAPRLNTSLEALPILMAYAQVSGDISSYLEDHTLAEITQQVCDQYDRDKDSRVDWATVAEKALKDMASTDFGEKSYPWPNASNVHYPLLGQAVMQFNARAYPAIVKGDEAVSVKVAGSDKGLPAMIMTEQGPQPAIDPQSGQVIQWQREPGSKAKRASRVADFMNFILFYRMDNWEGETDTLLFQMPAIGCAFRKSWFDGEKHNSRFVPALNLIIDNESKSLDDAPQIAEEISGVFPHHIRRDMATGKYRQVDFDPEEKEARLLLEVQCYLDLDEDGIEEPYIVTIDHKEKHVLRVVPDFGEEQVKLVDGRLTYIERREFYVKYEFLPHPEGKFYNPGLAHLLEQYSSVINTIINQMIDANHAATAGGGFVASGLRIQGQGQSSSLRWRPGEYKTIDISGSALRDGLVERTTPHLSPVMFQLLDLILGAAKDIASIKDVLSGDASNNGQVGTTLALIEQGLQVFTAIYKRVYRGLKDEYALLFANIGRHADEAMMREYVEFLDDPSADFGSDFSTRDMDIKPVSDPSSVTKMQKMARAQFLLGTAETLAQVGGDPKEALRRAYEAADVEDIDKLLPPPNPMSGASQQMEMAGKQADIKATEAKAAKDMASAQSTTAKVQFDFAKLEQESGVDAVKLQIEDMRAQIAAFEAGVKVAT